MVTHNTPLISRQQLVISLVVVVAITRLKVVVNHLVVKVRNKQRNTTNKAGTGSMSLPAFVLMTFPQHHPRLTNKVDNAKLRNAKYKQIGEPIMNFKQKLVYMLIGCLFTIAGYILASLGGSATHAQQNEQVLDKIVCRELEVVNKEGKAVVHINKQEHGGDSEEIRFYNNKMVNSPKSMTVSNNILGRVMLSLFNSSGEPIILIHEDAKGNGTIETRKGVWRTH